MADSNKEKQRERCKNMGLANRGKTLTEEHKHKIRVGNLKRKDTKEIGRRVGLSNKGRKQSLETRRKRSNAIKGMFAGDKHPNWKGGITPERKRLYHSPEYQFWRTSVFKKDSYTCIWCGKKGGRLNADHIKPWGLYPELRFDINNGRTLCEPCHRKTDTYCRYERE